MNENLKAFLDAIQNNEEEEDFAVEDNPGMPDEELQAVSGGSELGCVFGGSDISTSGARHCGCFVIGAVKGCGCAVVGSHTE